MELRPGYDLPDLLEFCDRFAMDFTALVNFCNSSLISRNSLAILSAVSSFMLHPFTS